RELALAEQPAGGEGRGRRRHRAGGRRGRERRGRGARAAGRHAARAAALAAGDLEARARGAKDERVSRRSAAAVLLATLIGLASIVAGCTPARDWRTASQDPVGLAPDPATTPEAVVQVYAARTVGWKSALGVHT